MRRDRQCRGNALTTCLLGLLLCGPITIVRHAQAQSLPANAQIPALNLVSNVPPERVLLEPEQPPLWTPAEEPWLWQVLPQGLIYKSYLAGAKESRLSSQHINVPGDGWLWD